MRASTVLGTVLVVTIACTSIPYAGMKPTVTLEVGEPAPRFSFAEVTTGETRELVGVAGGKPLLVVFLQTACRSCVREMIALKRLQQEGLQLGVLGVFVDVRDRGIDDYIRDYDLTFPFTWDADFALADAYGVTSTPSSFLLDPSGSVRAVYRGYTIAMEDLLRRDVGNLLKQR